MAEGVRVMVVHGWVPGHVALVLFMEITCVVRRKGCVIWTKIFVKLSRKGNERDSK